MTREYEKQFESEDYTNVKQTVFESMAYREMKFLAKRAGNGSITVIDLAGGKGFNTVSHRESSAGILCRIARNLNIKPNGILFERKNDVGLELKNFVEVQAGGEHFKVVLGNYHNKIVRNFIQAGRPYGMVYVDCHSSQKLFETLRNVAAHQHHFNLDLFAHFSARDFKRNAWKRQSDLTLKQHLQSINKAYVYVREPLLYKERIHQWTFAAFTNHRNFIDLSDLRFHDITSERGEEILNRLSSTNEERLVQRELGH